ncbi:hypothetical protein KY330_01460 [Candidatus Woesearchaeota archaeon]|nr:hypothetical protein [Candidatus Woesearchaeota archaeon]
MQDLSKKEAEALFQEFVEFLKKKKISVKGLGEYAIPISIFSKKLSATEAVVKYLREEHELGYNKIAKLLHKNPGPVGVTYRNAKKKFRGKLSVDSDHFIPINKFDGKNTVFEVVVKFMKEELKFSFKKIAKLMGRNYRTVWTVYRRAA